MAEALNRGEYRTFTLSLLDLAALREYFREWTRFTMGGQGSRKILPKRKLSREAKERYHVGVIPKEEREYRHQR